MDIEELFDDILSQGFSISKVAEETGIPYQTVQNIQKRISKNPDPENLKLIADAFGYILQYQQGVAHFYRDESELPEKYQRQKYVTYDEYEKLVKRLSELEREHYHADPDTAPQGSD